MGVHLEEFLYRGRPEGSPEPPAWHIVLVSLGKNDFGEVTRSERVLNMAQAKEAGWELPKIVARINSDTLVEMEAMREALRETEARNAGMLVDMEATRVALREAEARAAAAEERLQAPPAP